MANYKKESAETLFSMLYEAQYEYYKAATEFHPGEDYSTPHTFPDLEEKEKRRDEIVEELIARGLAEWI